MVYGESHNGKQSVTNSPPASYCLLLAELPESFKTPDEKQTASTAWEETHGTWGTVQNLKPKQESFFPHTDRPLPSLLGFFKFHVTSTDLDVPTVGRLTSFFPAASRFEIATKYGTSNTKCQVSNSTDMRIFSLTFNTRPQAY
jgi:hypothetical protein